jgi:hypothetical protein
MRFFEARNGAWQSRSSERLHSSPSKAVKAPCEGHASSKRHKNRRPRPTVHARPKTCRAKSTHSRRFRIQHEARGALHDRPRWQALVNPIARQRRSARHRALPSCTRPTISAAWAGRAHPAPVAARQLDFARSADDACRYGHPGPLAEASLDHPLLAPRAGAGARAGQQFRSDEPACAAVKAAERRRARRPRTGHPRVLRRPGCPLGSRQRVTTRSTRPFRQSSIRESVVHWHLAIAGRTRRWGARSAQPAWLAACGSGSASVRSSTRRRTT